MVTMRTVEEYQEAYRILSLAQGYDGSTINASEAAKTSFAYGKQITTLNMSLEKAARMVRELNSRVRELESKLDDAYGEMNRAYSIAGDLGYID